MLLFQFEVVEGANKVQQRNCKIYLMVTMNVDGGLKICKQGGLKTCEICVGFEDLVSMAMDLTLPIKN